MENETQAKQKSKFGFGSLFNDSWGFVGKHIQGYVVITLFALVLFAIAAIPFAVAGVNPLGIYVEPYVYSVSSVIGVILLGLVNAYSLILYARLTTELSAGRAVDYGILFMWGLQRYLRYIELVIRIFVYSMAWVLALAILILATLL